MRCSGQGGAGPAAGLGVPEVCACRGDPRVRVPAGGARRQVAPAPRHFLANFFSRGAVSAKVARPRGLPPSPPCPPACLPPPSAPAERGGLSAAGLSAAGLSAAGHACRAACAGARPGRRGPPAGPLARGAGAERHGPGLRRRPGLRRPQPGRHRPGRAAGKEGRRVTRGGAVADPLRLRGVGRAPGLSGGCPAPCGLPRIQPFASCPPTRVRGGSALPPRGAAAAGQPGRWPRSCPCRRG